MAYVDHAFSISDEDIMTPQLLHSHNRPPVKEISLAVALLVFGIAAIVSGVFMSVNRVGGDTSHVAIGVAMIRPPRNNLLMVWTHCFRTLLIMKWTQGVARYYGEYGSGNFVATILI
ncbi:hypothetical protein Tco_1168121 [Tanacetum coccineum]